MKYAIILLAAILLLTGCSHVSVKRTIEYAEPVNNVKSVTIDVDYWRLWWQKVDALEIVWTSQGVIVRMNGQEAKMSVTELMELLGGLR